MYIISEISNYNIMYPASNKELTTQRFLVSLQKSDYSNSKTTSGLLLTFFNTTNHSLMDLTNLHLTSKLFNFYSTWAFQFQQILMSCGLTQFMIVINHQNLYLFSTPNTILLENNFEKTTYSIQNNYVLQITVLYLNGIIFHSDFIT